MPPNALDYGSTTRQVHIEATPQVRYEVVSSPEHIAQWWTDEAALKPSPGRTGVLIWRGRATIPRDVDYIVEPTVVEAVPGERFSFRWVYP